MASSIFVERVVKNKWKRCEIIRLVWIFFALRHASSADSASMV